jgi:oligoendopeptidase F
MAMFGGSYGFFTLVMEYEKIFSSNRLKKISQLPQWDLKDLYHSFSSDLVDITVQVDHFHKKYKGMVQKLSGYELYKALLDYERISEILEKLNSCMLLKDSFVSNQDYKYGNSVTTKIHDLMQELVFFVEELNRSSDEEINRKLYFSSNLKKYYGKYLENLRFSKKYELTGELQRLVLDKNFASHLAWNKLFTNILGDMRFLWQGKFINLQQLQTILQTNDNRRLRQKADKLLGKGLKSQQKVLATIWNVLIHDYNVMNRWRGYKTPLSRVAVENFLEEGLMEKLLKIDYRTVTQRYYYLKARLLGKSKLSHTDVDVSLKFPMPYAKLSWPETALLVLTAYQKFSPKIAETAREFIDGHWINVFAGGNQLSVYKIVPQIHPYLAIGFNHNGYDALRLSYILSKGTHLSLSNDQSYLMFEPQLAIMEATAIMGQQLLFEHLQNITKDQQQKILLLANRIENLLVPFRLISQINFEKDVYEENAKGEVTVARLNELWLQQQHRFFGEAVELGNNYGYYWTCLPQLTSHPFAVVSQALGGFLANILINSYRQNMENFQEKYLNLLSSGNQKNYAEWLEVFWTDNQTPQDLAAGGLEFLTQLLNELEDLLRNNPDFR